MIAIALDDVGNCRAREPAIQSSQFGSLIFSDLEAVYFRK